LPQRNDDIPVGKIALEYVGEKIFSGDCLIDIDLLPLAGSGPAQDDIRLVCLSV
jgi:hypothetical protein